MHIIPNELIHSCLLRNTAHCGSKMGHKWRFMLTLTSCSVLLTHRNCSTFWTKPVMMIAGFFHAQPAMISRPCRCATCHNSTISSNPNKRYFLCAVVSIIFSQETRNTASRLGVYVRVLEANMTGQHISLWILKSSQSLA